MAVPFLTLRAIMQRRLRKRVSSTTLHAERGPKSRNLRQILIQHLCQDAPSFCRFRAPMQYGIRARAKA
jgi:hypothetical protein